MSVSNFQILSTINLLHTHVFYTSISENYFVLIISYRPNIISTDTCVMCACKYEKRLNLIITMVLGQNNGWRLVTVTIWSKKRQSNFSTAIEFAPNTLPIRCFSMIWETDCSPIRFRYNLNNRMILTMIPRVSLAKDRTRFQLMKIPSLRCWATAFLVS